MKSAPRQGCSLRARVALLHLSESLLLAQPLRLLGSNAPSLFCHAETLRLLGSRPQGLLLLAQPLQLLGSNAANLFCHAETLRLLGSRPQGRPQGFVFLSLGLICWWRWGEACGR